jgi:glycerol-3-phosphate dehydrogenase
VRGTGLPARLVRRYGSEAPDVAALADADPALLAPVVPEAPVLGVELVWGLLAEGALCAEDLLERRTRLSLVDRWAEAAGPVVEGLVAEVHAGGRA